MRSVVSQAYWSVMCCKRGRDGSGTGLECKRRTYQVEGSSRGGTTAKVAGSCPAHTLAQSRLCGGGSWTGVAQLTFITLPFCPHCHCLLLDGCPQPLHSLPVFRFFLTILYLLTFCLFFCYLDFNQAVLTAWDHSWYAWDHI